MAEVPRFTVTVEQMVSMDNPLSPIVPVEERQDGVYLKVGRDLNKQVLFKTILNALNAARVLNLDLEAIRGVVTRSRGVFERIGPPFEYYNPLFDKYIVVTKSPLLATIKVSATCIVDGIRPTPALVMFALEQNGVVHGIDTAAVQKIVAGELYDSDVEIARGTTAVNGEDGRVEYEVDIDKDNKPQLLPNGSVDFRSIKSFTQVAQGQVIARKVPPTPGVAGRSVLGQEIPAEPGVERGLVGGENIGVSEDGKYLLALKSGIIFEDHGTLEIKQNLEINHNVDFSVGNIKFSGNIAIRGNVLPGFVVESEEDIIIDGEVEAATVRSRNGSVTINKGVIGKNETVIFAKTGITVGFAQNAELTTEGRLMVERSCLHCTCLCETFETERSDATVVGGIVSAYKSITVANVGGAEGAMTRLALVDKERTALKQKHSELEDLRDKLQKEMAPIQKQLQSKAAMFKKAGAAVTERHRAELKKWLDQFNSYKMKCEYVDKKIVEIKAKISVLQNYDGFIKVTGDMMAGTQLELYGLTKPVKNTLTNKRIVLSQSEVEIGG